MSAVRFTWDERKARENIAKHGVSFEEARSVFADEHGLVVDDPDHSDDEERFILLGISGRLRILMVAHCVRDSESVVRIISSRRATRHEQAEYGRRRQR